MKYAIYALIFFVLSSCTTRKDVVYFQDIDSTSLSEIDSIFKRPVVQLNDILEINISALDQNSLVPFQFSADQQTAVNGYLVDAEGNIQFPIIGSLFVKGLNTNEVELLVQDSLASYIKSPIVQVRISNFKVTILGAVNKPGTYTVQEESINILQAIGLAGDFDINGKRSDVLIIREVNGKRNTIRVDFTKADWLNDPTYYIRQNDVIYVEPNYAEVKSAGIISDVNELLRVITAIIPTIILISTL